jgi:2-polyprenyl-6-methoxyphenol hydroxylase-like FAD-dependent oxidoreductase
MGMRHRQVMAPWQRLRVGDPARSHAVVIGASVAGLLTARVLSDRFERVTVLERDALTGEATPRKAVPQGQHLHILLFGGLQLLEEMFPDLREELLADGAQQCGTQDGIRYQSGRYLPRFPSDYHQLAMTRPFLELHLRRRVEALPNVTILDGHAVTRLLTPSEADRTRVTGVEVLRSSGSPEKLHLHADLVVDAGGRGSRAPAWLSALGYGRPPVEKITVGVGYTTRAFRRTAGQAPPGFFACILPAPRLETRAGAMLPVEEDRWLVTLSGWLGDHAAPDDDAFLSFAKSLPAPDIYEVIANAEAVGSFSTYSYPANLRRRYDRMWRHPDGFLVLGDALCSFNPIYGQGISVSAREAVALAATLDHRRDEIPRRFYRRAARVIDGPWRVTAGADFGFPGVTGTRPPAAALVNRYVARVQRRATEDDVVCRALVEVTIMVKPPTVLFTPRILWRVLGAPALRASARSRATSPAGERSGPPAEVS